MKQLSTILIILSASFVNVMQAQMKTRVIILTDIGRPDLEPDDTESLVHLLCYAAMGNHHDNFDCRDSKYQPWNAVNVGPHQDIAGTWEKVARKHGMPFGIGFHNTPARTWGQFMPPRYTSDKNGDKAGVPYDAIRKYQPDMIYFDDHAGDSQEDLGINMGLGRLTPQIIANFYNIASKRKTGNREVVATFKGVGGRYYSFQRNPELINIVDRSLVKSTELYTEDDIMAFPFQTEVSLQEWHYQQGGHSGKF